MLILTVDQGNDKASILWDDASSNWSVKLGNTLTDFKASNVDANVVKVPDGSGITINNVSLGNFASFDNAFTSALLLNKMWLRFLNRLVLCRARVKNS